MLLHTGFSLFWKKPRLQLLLFLIYTIIGPVTTPISQAQEISSYRFGVFPYLSPASLEKIYAPMASTFADALGHPVRFGTASGFDQFKNRIQAGDFDIALIQPTDIVPVVDEGGYIPLTRKPSKPARIVVLEDSSSWQAVDLRGKTVGLPPKNTPPGILIPPALNEQGLVQGQDVNYRYFTNVAACLHQLIVKNVDACGCAGGAALKVFQKKMKVKFRVLTKTMPFPHMLFVAHPRLSPTERETITRTILNWETTEQGRRLLRMIGKDVRFIPYRSADYDIIRNYYQRWQEDVKNIP